MFLRQSDDNTAKIEGIVDDKLSVSGFVSADEVTEMIAQAQLEPVVPDVYLTKTEAASTYASASTVRAIDDKFSEYAEAENVYTKTEVDELISQSGGGDVTKAYVDEQIATHTHDNYAEAVNVYTKTEVDELISQSGGGEVTKELLDKRTLVHHDTGLPVPIIIELQSNYWTRSETDSTYASKLLLYNYFYTKTEVNELISQSGGGGSEISKNDTSISILDNGNIEIKHKNQPFDITLNNGESESITIRQNESLEIEQAGTGLMALSSEAIHFYNNRLNIYNDANPFVAVAGRLVVTGDLSSPNVYTKTEVDELISQSGGGGGSVSSLSDGVTTISCDENHNVVINNNNNLPVLKIDSQTGAAITLNANHGTSYISLIEVGNNDEVSIGRHDGTLGFIAPRVMCDNTFYAPAIEADGLTVSGPISANNIYTKTEVDELISQSGGGGGDVTKAYVDEQIATHTHDEYAEAENVYTKTEVDAKITQYGVNWDTSITSIETDRTTIDNENIMLSTLKLAGIPIEAHKNESTWESRLEVGGQEVWFTGNITMPGSLTIGSGGLSVGGLYMNPAGADYIGCGVNGVGYWAINNSSKKMIISKELNVEAALTVSGKTTINSDITLGANQGLVLNNNGHSGRMYLASDGKALYFVVDGVYKYLWGGSQTITHHTNVQGEVGTFCETNGGIYDGYENIAETDCICQVVQSNTLNSKIVGIITSDTEFASHGDVLMKVVPGTYKLGDILCPDITGRARVATETELQYMMLHAIPRPKITSIATGIDNTVACFII